MAKQRKISQKTIDKYKLVVDEWFVNGFNGTKAYQSIYTKSKDRNATNRFSELVTISDISEYIKTKKENKSEELDITLTTQLKRLDVIIAKAEKEADKINAIKEQNKLLALYKNHNEQKKTEINISFED